MLFIHEQLKNIKYPNCTKLSRELGVKAVRTILRDIEFMRDQLLLPIDYDKQRRGYYYTRPVEPFPGVGVSESELFALLVAQKAVAHYRGTSFHEPLRTAFEKLTADLDPKVVVHLKAGSGHASDQGEVWNEIHALHAKAMHAPAPNAMHGWQRRSLPFKGRFALDLNPPAIRREP